MLTTNYDDVLTSVSGLQPVTWADPIGLQAVLRGNDQAIVHLHRHWRRSDSVVLGIRSYETMLGAAEIQSLERILPSTWSLLSSVSETVRTIRTWCFGGLVGLNFPRLRASPLETLPKRRVTSPDERACSATEISTGEIHFSGYGSCSRPRCDSHFGVDDAGLGLSRIRGSG